LKTEKLEDLLSTDHSSKCKSEHTAPTFQPLASGWTPHMPMVGRHEIFTDRPTDIVTELRPTDPPTERPTNQLKGEIFRWQDQPGSCRNVKADRAQFPPFWEQARFQRNRLGHRSQRQPTKFPFPGETSGFDTANKFSKYPGETRGNAKSPGKPKYLSA